MWLVQAAIVIAVIVAAASCPAAVLAAACTDRADSGQAVRTGGSVAIARAVIDSEREAGRCESDR